LGERGEKLRLGEYRGVKQGALSDSSSCCSAIRAAALSTAQTVASTATRGSCRGVITNAIRGGSTLGQHRGGATFRQADAFENGERTRRECTAETSGITTNQKSGVVRVNMLRAQE
jgi:hypothetical protein